MHKIVKSISLVLLVVTVFSCLTDHRQPVDPQSKKLVLTKFTQGSDVYTLTYAAKIPVPTFATLKGPNQNQQQTFVLNYSDKVIQANISTPPNGTFRSFINYSYDSDGKLLSKIRYVEISEHVANKYWDETYTYDSQNRINKTIRNYYFDENTTSTYSSTPFYTDTEIYEYDSRNNVIVLDRTRLSATQKFMNRQKYSLTYDDYPNPLYGIEMFRLNVGFPRSMSPNNYVTVRILAINDSTVPIDKGIELVETHTIQYKDGLPITDNFTYNFPGSAIVNQTYTYSPF